MSDGEVLKDFKEWLRRMEELALQKSRMQTHLTNFQNKSEELRCELDIESNHLSSLIRVQQDLLQSILAVVPIIEEKQNLELELSKAQKKLKKAENVHQKKLAAKKGEYEGTFEELERKCETWKKGALEKGKKAEVSHQREVSKMEEEIKRLCEISKKNEDMHLENLTDIEDKHKKEQEHLEKRIKLSKEHQSSQVFSDKDHLIQKVHAFELEYKAKLQEIEKDLIDCNAENIHLREELRAVKESLKHQKLLNVVRDVATLSRKDSNFPIAENNQMTVSSSDDTGATAGHYNIIDETSKVSQTKDDYMQEELGESSSNQSHGSLKGTRVRLQPRRTVKSKAGHVNIIDDTLQEEEGSRKRTGVRLQPRRTAKSKAGHDIIDETAEVPQTAYDAMEEQ